MRSVFHLCLALCSVVLISGCGSESDPKAAAPSGASSDVGAGLDAAKGMVEGAKDKAADAADTADAMVDETADASKSMADKATDKAKEMQEKGQSMLNDVMEQIKGGKLDLAKKGLDKLEAMDALPESIRSQIKSARSMLDAAKTAEDVESKAKDLAKVKDAIPGLK